MRLHLFATCVKYPQVLVIMSSDYLTGAIPLPGQAEVAQCSTSADALVTNGSRSQKLLIVKMSLQYGHSEKNFQLLRSVI